MNSHVEETRRLYQNDPHVRVGLYTALIQDAEARDEQEAVTQLHRDLAATACSCGGRGVCLTCVLADLGGNNDWSRRV